MSALSSSLRSASLAAALFAGLAGAVDVYAYTSLGGSWKNGSIPMRLQLDATAPAVTMPLQDGSTSWNTIAQQSLAAWNAEMIRSQLTSTTSTSSAAEMYDGINSVLFATTIYGDAFDSTTLGVTLVNYYDDYGLPTPQITEADLIINKNRTWNSYSGVIRSNPLDFRRVLLHELGHVIGLDHPDQANQNVTALMNSTVSNVAGLQTDDRSGANYLYPAASALPASNITLQPTAQSGAVGSSVALTFGLNGSTTPPEKSLFLNYRWYFKASGASAYEPLFTVNTGTLSFGTLQLLDAGSYYVQIQTPNGTVNSNAVNVAVTPVTLDKNTCLFNLSTRALNGSATNPLTVGFVISGTDNKRILLRAVGPTLADPRFGISNPLSDPKLTLVNQTTGAILATSTAIWSQAANAAEIRTTTGQVYGFPLQEGSRDAVLLVSLPPGAYTAVATSPSSGLGTVLFEAYDADTTKTATSSRFYNLSTRGYVSTGNNVMVAGFVVSGTAPRTYLIRLAGPTLASKLGVTDTLYDPYLKLYRHNDDGSGDTLIRETDDWDSPSATQPSLKAAAAAAYAFAFDLENAGNRRESSMLVTLAPGQYTAMASGNDNGGDNSPSGNALIEIYELNL
ncbi:matrixin family metalloprotease [Opitutus sp. ER46]|uniref:matrixin family metalloprotease n=1 Tax=Opitutus sp. ER46 TaxID=2161864 RepID=UPI000D30C024|nr:matrixin family metalloprotease [Opitutus sp. ER46]PTX97710.1 hypothetical protein DB354_05365 [Opitutus sp. ER46]